MHCIASVRIGQYRGGNTFQNSYSHCFWPRRSDILWLLDSWLLLLSLEPFDDRNVVNWFSTFIALLNLKRFFGQIYRSFGHVSFHSILLVWYVLVLIYFPYLVIDYTCSDVVLISYSCKHSFTLISSIQIYHWYQCLSNSRNSGKDRSN